MKHQVVMPSDIDFERLSEIIAAEREGRCRVLPCKVGDTAWVISRRSGVVRSVTVDSFHLFSSRRDTVETVELDGRGGKLFRRWKLNQFGRVLFLSREEAEAALEFKES